MRKIEKFWDLENKKPRSVYFRDENQHLQGEMKTWHRNGQIDSISNYKNNNLQGLQQLFAFNGEREIIDTNHHKKRRHGTKIEFGYEKK